MNLLQRYNQARDREQEAFDASPLGEECRGIHNAHFRGVVACISPALVLSLAAEYAFGRRMPAFYAGRALRIW